MSAAGLDYQPYTKIMDLVKQLGYNAIRLPYSNELVESDPVVTDKVNVRTMEDVERAIFRVNASYARDLKDALRPGRKEPEKRRRRRG